MSDIEARRAANRAAFPGVGKIIDEFREEFSYQRLVTQDGLEIEVVTEFKVEGGVEAGNSFGVDSWPACAGCSDGLGCGNSKVFCGHRLVASSSKPQPIEVYRRHGMGQRK